MYRLLRRRARESGELEKPRGSFVHRYPLVGHPRHPHWQALPKGWQQNVFFSCVHPALQLLKPMLQSIGGQVVVTGGGRGHPLFTWWQHHAFFPPDQPACQFWKPSVQSKGRDVTGAGAGTGTGTGTGTWGGGGGGG